MNKFIPVLAAAALVSAPAFAQKARHAAANVGGEASQATQEFVTKVEMGTHVEIESAQVALKQAQDKKVKQFAQRMIKDHTKAGNMLKSAVKSDKGANLPDDTPIDADHQKMIDNLKSAQGADFDKQYVKMMVDDHEEDSKDFDDYAKNGDDPKIKAFAKKTAPVIHKHLKMIQQIDQQMQKSAQR
jgi:putative membrane protein